MFKVDELIDCLQQKIQKYRQVQQSAGRIRNCLLADQQHLSSSVQHLSTSISNQIAILKQQATDRITAIGTYCSTLVYQQRQAYEQQLIQLRGEISRQYKVITLMRQQLQDLMAMLNQRRANQQPKQQQQSNGQTNTQTESNEQNYTINGLEVIEQETERTVVSSAQSFNEEARFTHSDHFIRIEERGFEDQEYSLRHQPSFQMQTEEREKFQKNNSEEDEWNSNSKFEKLLQSGASRQNLYLCQQEDGPSQWQSMPLSVQGGQQGRTEQSQECRANSHELREITNQNQQDRQSKTKMFLQQFRKTFNKCLSSANVSRKQSKSSISKPPKDKTKSMNATFGKVEGKSPSGNQKLITDMLKDIDNNNKFAVGNRRSELKYEGQKKQGNRAGQGVLYYSNGLSYEGEFRNNLRHGYGVLRFNQIEIYRGDWATDELSGQGKIRNFAVINKHKNHTSSSPLTRWVSYCGSFRGNRFEGEGTLYLQGGQKFLGRFIGGSACGEGTLYKKNGEVQTGVWRHSQLVQHF